MPIEAFAIPAPELAKELLSSVIMHGETAGMIVETEAYLGGEDLAAHSSRGLTDRTKVIFGPAGRAYVYLIYGMYECFNVVADLAGTPGCVLVRAVEPLCGLKLMCQRRKMNEPAVRLTNGPGKLTRALAITRRHYGLRLDKGRLVIRRWRTRPIFETQVTPRVGISECADWPLRFVWNGHPYVSRPPEASCAGSCS
jgi:DNA-3-methyladenine glycosylase